jgi:hypothetical protein
MFSLLNTTEYLLMKFKLWREYGALNSRLVFDAFARSVISSGHSICESTNYVDSDVHVIWSVLFHGRMSGNRSVWNNCRATGKPVIVIEVGGIKRGVTWKVGLNGINRDAYFGSKNNDSSRAQLFGLEPKPWKESGEYILICGQHDRSLQWNGMPPMSQWTMNIIEQIQRYTDKPIIFRPHPRCRLDHIEHQYQNVYRQEPIHITGTYDDYNLTFAKAHAVISWSSNPGIQAVINGVPAFVGTSSLAYDAANDIDFLHDIENPCKPNRQQWINDYAWTEYTVEEIAQGLPLKRLTDRL